MDQERINHDLAVALASSIYSAQLNFDKKDADKFHLQLSQDIGEFTSLYEDIFSQMQLQNRKQL
ncbi:hypothetical protein GJW58_12465 [Listeria monocytogenes]|nr:hypothetical protein [Listeria monocytogenes]EDN9846532.1 hypothetical protein [Listeria monocytogenes]